MWGYPPLFVLLLLPYISMLFDHVQWIGSWLQILFALSCPSLSLSLFPSNSLSPSLPRALLCFWAAMGWTFILAGCVCVCIFYPFVLGISSFPTSHLLLRPGGPFTAWGLSFWYLGAKLLLGDSPTCCGYHLGGKNYSKPEWKRPTSSESTSASTQRSLIVASQYCHARLWGIWMTVILQEVELFYLQLEFSCLRLSFSAHNPNLAAQTYFPL